MADETTPQEPPVEEPPVVTTEVPPAEPPAEEPAGEESGEEIADASKGSIVLDAQGKVVLDEGTETREPRPSPYEARDSLRNADDRASNPSDDPDPAVQEAMSRIGWQVGQLDTSSSGEPTLLANLAFPSEAAVKAHVATVAAAQAGAGEFDAEAAAARAADPYGVAQENADGTKYGVTRERSPDDLDLREAEATAEKV